MLNLVNTTWLNEQKGQVLPAWVLVTGRRQWADHSRKSGIGSSLLAK
jgi:hypothetical protein